MSRALPRFTAHLERMADEEKIARIVLETGGPAQEVVTSRTVTRADHTDGRRLRGIPVCGFGGAIPGTRPGA